VNIAVPTETVPVAPKLALGFWATLPLIRIGDVEMTPWSGEPTLVNDPPGTAAQEQPGESVRLNENVPPRPGKVCDWGETLGLQSVGTLRSILITKTVSVGLDV